MRYVCSTAAVTLALTFLAPTALLAQGGSTGLSITNYKFVSELRATRTQWYVTYKADLVNTGAARSGVVATLSSLVPSVQTVSGQNTLHFSPVPANSQVTSTDTFTILVDRGVPFDFANLKWTFVNPVADPGPDQTLPVGSTVVLNGSGSTNPSGVGTLSYSWAFASKPPNSSAVLQTPNGVSSSFVIDVPGNYVINLTVDNGVAQDTKSVKISTTNSPPVAKAGPNQSVSAGATVQLNGSGSSDVDGDPLTYAWTFVSVPAGSTATLANATNPMASFVADKQGTFVVQLAVSDGKAQSTSTVTITVGPAANTPPVANAGPNQSNVAIGSTVQLNGSGSTDVNGDPLTYKWTLISVPTGSAAQLSNPNIVNPTFVADKAGTYIAQLVVNDGKVDSPAATVTITTAAPINAPTANAGANQTVKHGTTVQLSGSGADPQNLPLTYSWSFTNKPQGSTAQLSSATVANPTFLADLPGQYVAQLIVNNGTVASSPATVTITTTNTAPVANAGANQTGTVGKVVTLDGGGSTDADNDPLTYAWSFTTRPNGSTATLSAANSKNPTFVPDVAGTYVVQLIVSDPFTSSDPKTVTITVGGALAITTSALGQGIVGAPYNFTVQAAGGTQPYQWSATGLPANLTINTSTGQITGTPTAQGTFNNVKITVTDAANGSVTSTFTLTVVQATPSSIAVQAGSGQSAQINAAFGTPLQAVVKDANGNPISGIAVTFTAPSSGPSGTFAGNQLTATVNTNASGIAIAPAFTANTKLGAYNVVASTPNNLSTTFALTNTVGAAAKIAVSSGSPQSTQAGTAFSQPLKVLVTDAGDNPVSGVSVTFTAPANGASGTFAGGQTTATATTDASGIATSPVFTANGTSSATAYNVVASLTNNSAVNVNFVLTNTTGAASKISVSSGSGQSAEVSKAFAQSLKALVTDANNNPVSGVTVTFTAPANGASGTFAGGQTTASANTDASGIATSPIFTANNKPGTYNVSASANGNSTNFALTNTIGAAAKISISGGSPQSAEVGKAFAQPLKALVTDAFDNPVGAGVSVTFTAPANGASGTFAGGQTTNTVTTDANGIATSAVFTANGTTGGPYNVSAALTNNSAVNVNFALTNTAGQPSSITIQSGSGQNTEITKAFANPLKVVVKDSFGNLLSGVTVTFTLKPGGTGASATFAGGQTTAVTDSNGVATSAALTANDKVGQFVVTAQAGTASADFTLNNTPGQPASLTIVSGDAQSTPAGSAFGAPFKVIVKDAGGNPLQNITVTFAPSTAQSGATGTFAGGQNTAVTDATGTATSAAFTANNKVGSYTVVASAGSLNATFNVTNQSGPPTTITVVDGAAQNTAVKTAFAKQLKVSVTDAQGNPVSGVTVTFTAPSGNVASGTFANGTNTTTAVTDASGVATSSTLTANSVAGNFTVMAGAPNLQAVSILLTNNPGKAATITKDSGDAQNTTVLTPFPSPLKVLVKDVDGNPVRNLVINFTIKPGGTGAAGSFPGNVATAQAQTDNNGFATSPVITANGTTGSFVVTASDSTNANLSTDFTLSNSAAGPCCITILGGNNQTTAANSDFATPLSFTVKDNGGNLLRGVQVVLTAPAAPSAGATFPNNSNTITLTTDSAGVASTAVKANGTAGSYNVVANIPGTSAAASFNLTNSTAVGPALTLCVTDCSAPTPTITTPIGKNLQTTITVNLPAPAPPGLPLTVTSSDPSKVLVGTAVPSFTTNLIEGTTQVGVIVQALSDTGTATVSFSAPGYSTATATITLTPSGFVISGPPPGGFGAGFTTPQKAVSTLTVTAVRLSNGAPAGTQLLRNGITAVIPVSLSVPSLGSLSSPTVTIGGGASSGTVNFTASSTTTGATDILLDNTGAGYTQPTAGASLTATVIQSNLTPFTATVGKGLEKAVRIGLSGPAPTLVPVTITSLDPSKVKFAKTPTEAGSGSITVNIPVNLSSTPDFYVQAFDNTGTVGYTASAPGYGTINGTVTLAPSGFAIQTPAGLNSNFQVQTGVGNPNLDVYVGVVSGNFITETQLVAGGTSIPVTVTSATPSVGTITLSPITIQGGTLSATTQFQPAANGTTQITASSPGYQSAQVTATVVSGKLFVSSGLSVGKGLQDPGGFVTLPFLSSSDAGTNVQITSNNPAALKLSATETGPSQDTITVNVPKGATTASFWVRGFASTGTATFTATVPGLAPASGSVDLTSSSILLIPSTFTESVSGKVGGSTTASLIAYSVDANGAVIQPQELIGGALPDLGWVTSSNPSVATLVPATYPESDHPYPNNKTTDWTWTSLFASSNDITFDPQTLLGPGDKLFILDANGNNITGSPFTGNSLAGVTVNVPTSGFTIRLVSDATGNAYGFKVTNVVPHGSSVRTSTILFKAVGTTVLTVNQPTGFIVPTNFKAVTVTVNP